jgi:hypothetical protein
MHAAGIAAGRAGMLVANDVLRVLVWSCTDGCCWFSATMCQQPHLNGCGQVQCVLTEPLLESTAGVNCIPLDHV